MAMTQKEKLQKEMEMAVARKAMDDADCVLKADRNQNDIDRIQVLIDKLPKE
jgi:hypothetical protein